MKMTRLEAFKLIRSFGMAASFNDGEWRIDYKRDDPRKTPDSCYYTNDTQDAIDTACLMSQFKL